MAKTISLEYNGELGYLATIEEVVLNVFKIYAITPEQFLDYKYKEITNREIIFLHYTLQQKIDLQFADDDGNVTKTNIDVTSKMICPFVTFFIDAKYVTKNLILNNSTLLTDDFSVTQQEENEYGNFLGTLKINQFFENYVSKVKTVDIELPNINFQNEKEKFVKNKKQHLNPTVWIWCKSLNENQKFNNYSIFDLTPFIESIETSMSESGGNFNLKLLSIEGFINVDETGEASGVWSVKKDRYLSFNEDNRQNFLFKNYINSRWFQSEQEIYTGGAYVERIRNYDNQIGVETVNVSRKIQKNSISSDFFFKNLISENDIVFISFNEIDVLPKNDDFFISNDRIPLNDYHMIGLIDRNSISTNYDGAEISTNVGGRDLMKLLIEDGSYFFPKSYSNETDNSIFENVDLPNSGDDVNTTNKVIDNGQKGANRLVMSGMIENLFLAEARNVHFVMNLLMSTLSNIEICPSKLFEYYGDRVTQFQIPIYETVKKSELVEEDDKIEDVDL